MYVLFRYCLLQVMLLLLVDVLVLEYNTVEFNISYDRFIITVHFCTSLKLCRDENLFRRNDYIQRVNIVVRKTYLTLLSTRFHYVMRSEYYYIIGCDGAIAFCILLSNWYFRTWRFLHGVISATAYEGRKLNLTRKKLFLTLSDQSIENILAFLMSRVFYIALIAVARQIFIVLDNSVDAFLRQLAS